MSKLSQTLEARGIRFERVDSPNALPCWAPSSEPVSIVVEPPADPGESVIDLAARVAIELERFAGRAVDFLCDGLQDPQYGLTPDEIALLSAAERPFGSPEAVIWGDGTWMIRFGESSLRIAEEFGIGVNFNGEQPVSIENLSDAEYVDEE